MLEQEEQGGQEHHGLQDQDLLPWSAGLEGHQEEPLEGKELFSSLWLQQVLQDVEEEREEWELEDRAFSFLWVQHLLGGWRRRRRAEPERQIRRE